MRRRAALAALVIAVAAKDGLAQSLPADGAARRAGAAPAKSTIPVHALGTVDVVAAKRADDRREATTTRIVVLHDEIVRYGDTTLGDVLQRLPGITVDGARRGRSGISMHGLGNGYTQILLDGEPAPAGFDLDSLSPELIERIEILRAPTADLGTQAIAGTINIVLRKTVRNAHRSVKLRASAEHGQPGYGVDADLSDRQGRWAYLMAASIGRDKHDRPSAAEQRGIGANGDTDLLWRSRQRNVSDAYGGSLAPRITWSPGGDDTVTSESFIRRRVASGRNSEQTTTLEGASPAFGADDTDYRYDRMAASSRVDWVHRLAEGSTLDMKLGVTYSDWTGDVAFRGFDDDGEFSLDRSVQSETIERGFTSAGKYVTPIVEGHALAVGWDGQYTHRDERRLQTDETPEGALLAYIDERYRSRVSRLAFYGQDDWNVTPRWSAYLGVRWEALDTRTAGSAIAQAGNASSVLSPIFQTLWKPNHTNVDQFRFSVSRTFKAPRTSELTPRRYLATNNTETTPDYRGNPDLRPELAWGLDAAYEHYFSESGFAGLSAFARRIDDVIVDRLANIGGTWMTSPANDGTARVYGIEAEAKLDLRDWRKSAPNVRIHANAARNWSALDAVPGPDNRLERQRPFTANAGFDYVLDGCPLTLGANFGFRAGTPVRLSLTQRDDLPVRRVLDLYALWKADPKTRIRVSLANVLGQDQTSATSYFDDSGTLLLGTTTPTRTVVRIAVELAL